MNHESEDRLKAAARALRETPVHPDVTARGERAVLARVGRHRGSNRPVLLWAAGFAAATAVVGVFALAPTRASAAEILRIGRNADLALRHQRNYGVGKDGTLHLGLEMWVQNGHRRMVDQNGWQAAYDGRKLDVLWPDGDVTREYGGPKDDGILPLNEGSARDLIADNMKGDAQLGVQRAVKVNGRVVDRYTIDRLRSDGEAQRQTKVTLDADPQTERPLSMRITVEGTPESLVIWDYPAATASLFEVPIESTKRLYDLPAQRASVLSARRQPGLSATVAGQRVALLQLWVDEDGAACAVARADYAYPEDYGMRVAGHDTGFRPEKPPFSGQWMIHEPTDGGEQLIWLTRGFEKRRAYHFPERLTVMLPVCKGKRLLGYARFEDVPVHRTHSVYGFLRPNGYGPFWQPSKAIESPTRAVQETRSARP